MGRVLLAGSECVRPITRCQPRLPGVRSLPPLEFQGDDQNRGPQAVKTGGWDARRPHPPSGQPVPTRNQLDLRLESLKAATWREVRHRQTLRLLRVRTLVRTRSNAARTRTAVLSSPPLPASVRRSGAVCGGSGSGCGLCLANSARFPSAGLEFPPLARQGGARCTCQGSLSLQGDFQM